MTVLTMLWLFVHAHAVLPPPPPDDAIPAEHECDEW